MARPCLFLDAGGVLLDETEFEALHAEVICELLRERGLDYSLEDYWRDAEEAVRLFVPRVYAWSLSWKRGDRLLPAVAMSPLPPPRCGRAKPVHIVCGIAAQRRPGTAQP